MRSYILKGENITDFKSFLKEFGEMARGPGGYFGNDLFQFDDCLFGYGGLEYPCEIIWQNHELSKIALDDKALISECEKLKQAFERQDAEEDEVEIQFSSDMANYYLHKIISAKEQKLTLFDELTACIQSVKERNSHCSIRLTLK